MSKSVLVLGAASTIAEAVCRIYAKEGARLLLVARNGERLESIAADLRVRGASEVSVIAGDLAKIDPAKVIDESVAGFGNLDVVLLAYGILGDQRECEQDLAQAAQMIDTNFRSATMWALAAANQLEKQKSGTLVVIGSVAGDRGRQSNYLYGATKGGLAVLVQGIAHRLAACGAHAVLVKPGFVDTAMTAHIHGKGLLWSSPEKVAGLIRKAADSGKAIAYVPGYWRLIMAVIKSVPSAIFHRTKL